MSRRRRMLGLRGKFLILILGPVLCVFLLVTLYSRYSFKIFHDKISKDGTALVRQLAEKELLEKARSLAKQIELALQLYPDIDPADFNSNPKIRELALQKVGKTGYTVLWQRPSKGNPSAKLLVHPNKAVLGSDIITLATKSMGEKSEAFNDIFTRAFYGDESEGYYPWRESNGEIREKFMANAPVNNTPYVVGATTYIDEFTIPMENLQNEITTQNDRVQQIHMAITGIGLLLVTLILLIVIQRFSKQITNLTQVISDVSTGKTEKRIAIPRSGDELQDLAEAVERMRTGIHFLMQRQARKPTSTHNPDGFSHTHRQTKK